MSDCRTHFYYSQLLTVFNQDHDVPEEFISFVCLIASKPGVQAIAYAFPKVRIIMGELDPDIDEHYHICPGLGNFGDRFFGTS